MKKTSTSSLRAGQQEQALTLHHCIAALIREFKIEPGLLAGSVYSDLHANDIGLFEVLASAGSWNVQAVARALGAPITTISSALDRLERSGLIVRKRIPDDRRVVLIELTAAGHKLASRLLEAHMKNCHAMLARLVPSEREVFLRLASKIAQPAEENNT